jgi:hypothetical protein
MVNKPVKPPLQVDRYCLEFGAQADSVHAVNTPQQKETYWHGTPTPQQCLTNKSSRSPLSRRTALIDLN